MDTVKIFLFLAASPFLMKLRLERVDALVSRPVRQRAADPRRVARTIRIVDFALRFGWPVMRSGCIARGLALYYFLRRLGLDVKLVFGAGHMDDRFAAHCWLERNNEPYLEKVDPRHFFAPVYRFGCLR
jgi:hypothetical protein